MTHIQTLKNKMLGKVIGGAEVLLISPRGRGYQVLYRVDGRIKPTSLTNFNIMYGGGQEKKIFTNIEDAIREADRLKRVYDQCYIVVKSGNNELFVTAKKNKPYLKYMYSTANKGVVNVHN